MPYVTVRGHATHYETVGEGEPVLLLHGGFCSNMMMQQLAESLAGSFTVWSPERPGHGRTADQDGAMSYAGGLEQTIAFLDAVGIEKARVVGSATARSSACCWRWSTRSACTRSSQSAVT